MCIELELIAIAGARFGDAAKISVRLSLEFDGAAAGREANGDVMGGRRPHTEVRLPVCDELGANRQPSFDRAWAGLSGGG